MNAIETAAILDTLQHGFPNFKPDEITLGLWTEAMAPVDFRDAKAAVRLVCQGQADIDPNFVPTVAVFFRLCEDANRDRNEREDRARRSGERMLEARTESTRSESSERGAIIRDRLARGEKLTQIVDSIGRLIPPASPSERELNKRKNALLDELGPDAKPKPKTLNEDDFKKMGGGA